MSSTKTHARHSLEKAMRLIGRVRKAAPATGDLCDKLDFAVANAFNALNRLKDIKKPAKPGKSKAMMPD